MSKYAAQVDIFGNGHAIIPGVRVIDRPALFDCIDLDDTTYGGTVEQATLDGSQAQTAATLFRTDAGIIGASERTTR